MKYVLLSGAETQKLTAPGVTEARLMFGYIRERCKDLDLVYFLNENSYTSFDNIYNGGIKIENNELLCADGELTGPCIVQNEVILVNGYGTQLNAELKMYLDRVVEYLHNTKERPGTTIFCEASRSLKVLLLAWFFIPGPRRLETASWELGSPIKELCQTLYDFVAIFVPGLATYARNKRIKHSYTI